MSIPNISLGKNLTRLCLLFALGVSPVALAEDPAIDTEAPPTAWDVSLVAGLGLTDGNTDTLDILTSFSADYIGDVHEIYLGTDFTYSEVSDATTSESVHSSAQYNRLLSDRFYIGVVGDFLYDDIAAIDYRVSAIPTLGYYLIKNDRTTLALEAGGGYLWENVGDVKSEYFALRFAERLTHQLTDTLSFYQSVAFLPEAGDWNIYTLTAEAGIESKVSDRLSLRLFANDRYSSRPAAGLDKNDLGIFTAISIALGRVDPIAADAKSGIAATGGSDWDLSLAVGGSYTDGNSDTLAIAADLSAERITDANEMYLGAGGAYGESNSVRNRESVYAFGQYNELLTDRLYLGGRTDFLYDAITALDYRITPALLLGCYLVKNDTTSLAFEVGPSFTWEDQAGIADEYFGVAFGEKFSHKMSDRVELWQSARLILDIDNTNNYVLDAQAGIDIKIGERLSLRTAAQDIYDADPAGGFEKNDFRLTSGLVFSF